MRSAHKNKRLTKKKPKSRRWELDTKNYLYRKEDPNIASHVRTKFITCAEFNLAKLYDPLSDVHKSKLAYVMWMGFNNVGFF